ncbi:MAG: hypothetical protein K6A67_06155 [Bacteroidales bacterium]|nr:hypothetical protein [Bacteroidales bacterium]
MGKHYDILDRAFTIPDKELRLDLLTRWMFPEEYKRPRLINENTDDYEKAAIMMACLYLRNAQTPNPKIVDQFAAEMKYKLLEETFTPEELENLDTYYISAILYLYRSYRTGWDMAEPIVLLKDLPIDFAKDEDVLCYDTGDPRLLTALLARGCRCTIYDPNPVKLAMTHIVSELLSWDVDAAYTSQETNGHLYDKAVMHLPYGHPATIFDLLGLLKEKRSLVVQTTYENNVKDDAEWVSVRKKLAKEQQLSAVHLKQTQQDEKSPQLSVSIWHITKGKCEAPLFYDHLELYSSAEPDVKPTTECNSYPMNCDANCRFVPVIIQDGVAIRDVAQIASSERIIESGNTFPVPLFQHNPLLCKEDTVIDNLFGSVKRVKEACIGLKVNESDVQVCKISADRDTYVPDNVTLFKVMNDKRCNPDYILWALTHPEMRNQLLFSQTNNIDGYTIGDEDFLNIRIPLPSIEEQTATVRKERERQMNTMADEISSSIPLNWSVNKAMVAIKDSMQHTHGEVLKDAQIHIVPNKGARTKTKGKYQILFVRPAGEKTPIEITNVSSQVLYVFLLVHHGESFTTKSMRNYVPELFSIHRSLFVKKEDDGNEKHDRKFRIIVKNLMPSSNEITYKNKQGSRLERNKNLDLTKNNANAAVKVAVDSELEESRFIITYVDEGLSIACRNVKICKEFKEEMAYWKDIYTKFFGLSDYDNQN